MTSSASTPSSAGTPGGADRRPRGSSRSAPSCAPTARSTRRRRGPTGDTVHVRLAERVRGVAPGQSVVLYDGTRVVGSATIRDGRTAPRARPDHACRAADPQRPTRAPRTLGFPLEWGLSRARGTGLAMVAQGTGSDHLVDRVRAHCMAFPRTQERQQPRRAVLVRRREADVRHVRRPPPRRPCRLLGGRRRRGAAAPRRGRAGPFFRPPYVGVRGWVGMWLDDDPDWDRVEQLVEEAWRCIAGPRLIKEWAARR